MARRGNQSFEKRQREMQKQERAQQKEARREERRAAEDEGDDVDEAALMAEYAKLAEAFDEGTVTAERFAERKSEIFETLGLEVD